MTTYTGKDVTFKIGGTKQGESQEFSFEMNNGHIGVLELGSVGIQSHAWGQYSGNGNFKIFYTEYGMINDVTTFGTTKTLSLEFGAGPDYTLTMNNVKYGEYTLTFGLDEPVTLEVNYTVETVSYSW